MPYEDWQIVYRKLGQLERAIDGEPQLLESVLSSPETVGVARNVAKG